jgi:nucleoporin NUP42
MAKDFDAKADKPLWPLSSYGPAKNEKNLLPPLDESPEELRFRAVTAIRNGNINEYVRPPIPFGKAIP